MSSAGVSGFFVSAARRDILTEAPDTDILESALTYVEEPVIAAGGVRHLDDLRMMMELEVGGRTLAGLVVGREVTEGRFTVEQAQAIITGTEQVSTGRVRQLRTVIHVADLDRSADFYEGVLGFRRLDAWDTADHDGVLVEASDGRMVELLCDRDQSGFEPPRGLGLVFVVDDVNAWHDRLQGAGAKITMGIDDRAWGHRSFGLADPDGVPVTISQVLH